MLKFGLHVGSYHLYGCNVMSILYVESGPKVMIIYIPQEKKNTAIVRHYILSVIVQICELTHIAHPRK